VSLHVPIVLKSGSLNLLEPSEPVQAFNRNALPLFTVWEDVRVTELCGDCGEHIGLCRESESLPACRLVK